MFADAYGWDDARCMSMSFMKQHLYLDRLLARRKREAAAANKGRAGGGGGSSSSSGPAPLITSGNDVAALFG